MDNQSNITKGDKAKSKKGRFVILVCDTSSCSVVHFCQVPSKYSKGYSSYRADEKFIFFDLQSGHKING